MKILLCDMPVSNDQKFGTMKAVGSTLPPFNLLMLGTILKEAHHQVIVTTEYFGLKDVADIINDFEPDIVGVTFMTLGFPHLQAFCDMVEEYSPKAILITGGYHSSLYPDQILRDYPRINAIFKGESEVNLPKFVGLCSSGFPTPDELADIPGIYYRDGEDVLNSGPALRVEDLDELPFPEYDMIPGYFNYFHSAVNRHYFKMPQATFLTGRGCPYECNFCGRMMLGRTVRQNSVEYLLEHIKYVRKKYGINSIVYLDEFLTQNRKKMEHFCEELVTQNLDSLHWSCSGRINNMNVEFARILHRGGCREICYGLESGSQKIIDMLVKKATIEKMSNAVRTAHEGGLSVTSSFILGSPGETHETLEETRSFIMNNPLNFIIFCFFTPFPGTAYWDKKTYKKYGTMVDGDLKNFNLFSGIPFVPHGLTVDDLRNARTSMNKEFYLRPSRLAREMRHINNLTSWKYAGRIVKTLTLDPISLKTKKMFQGI